MAEDHQTALREVSQIGRDSKLTPASGPKAVVLFAVKVDLRNVLDLTMLGVQRALGTTGAELAGPWRYLKSRKKPPTHVLGKALAQCGIFDAARYQSTKGPGGCFVIFVDQLKPPAFVRVRDPQSNLVEELP